MALFDKSKTTSTAKPTRSATKGDNQKIQIAGMNEYAAMIAMKKALEAAIETLDGEIKGVAMSTFVARGAEDHKRPDNLKVFDGAAQNCSVQLKQLSSRSKISDENVARLEAANIPLEILDEVVETFVINPIYAGNEKLIAAVEAALSNIDVPDDFILHQSQKKVVANDETLDAIFKLPAKQISELLPMVSTLAIRSATTHSLRESIDVVLDCIDPREQ